eukprot:583467-Pleurochrysis_carterae.AAC.1
MPACASLGPSLASERRRRNQCRGHERRDSRPPRGQRFSVGLIRRFACESCGCAVRGLHCCVSVDRAVACRGGRRRSVRLDGRRFYD